MIQFKAPEQVSTVASPKVFLAGSIEEGVAEEWQDKAVRLFSESDVTILNPRRDEWDPTWEQRIDNIEFKHQVEWELNGMDMADMILFYFDPKTKSPITLLELGLHATSGKCLMICPQGFWRKGNVDIICERNAIPQFETIEACVEYIKLQIAK
jgi:hypothetical protein